jgi:3-deoxy-7-phosphoheptulonate synthase
MPVGFKNSTDGSVEVAVDACLSARAKHCFLGVMEQGLSGIVETEGNEDVHVILRGGTKGPNYEAKWVEECAEKMRKKGLRMKVMVCPVCGLLHLRVLRGMQIDCSHGNSQKNHNNQPIVAANIVRLLPLSLEKISHSHSRAG